MVNIKKERKQIFVLLMAMLLTTGLSAQVKLRLGGVVDWDQDQDVANLGGIQLELIGEHLGFGLNAMGDGLREEIEPYSANWEGELFVSYHLFGNNSFIDPYLQAGVGNGGFVSWTSEDNVQDLQLSLYPAFHVGVNAVFEEGLYLGFNYGYRSYNRSIPATNITRYEQSRNQFTLQIGYQFGGREPRDRSEEREQGREKIRGSWKWQWCEND